MEQTKLRPSSQLANSTEEDLLSVQLTPMPEFVHIADRHLIWRNSARPRAGQPVRIITWEICLQKNEITIRADLENAGEMQKVDFREVSKRLDEILISENIAEFNASWHQKRIRRSLYWQRTPDDGCEHMNPPKFNEDTGAWSFNYSLSHRTPDWDMSIDGDVIRPASNEMYMERHQERQWLAYADKQLEWARLLSLDPDFSECLEGTRDICSLRLLYYWQIPECRQLFTSSKNFTILFCTPGLLTEMDDIDDGAWKITVTRLSQLPRNELIGLIGLPPTDQVVQLFLRIKPREIIPHLSLIRQAFAKPIAIERLSETTCGIDEMMLSICQREDFPFHWPLFRELCCNGETCDPALSYIHYEIDFFLDGPIGRHVRKFYLNARSTEEIKSATRIARWYRRHWQGLFKPGVRDALGNLTTLLPETDNIRLLNCPDELINISNENELSLNQYMILISEGKYALYQVNYLDEFAVVGIFRSENEPWRIDQIMGPKNAVVSEFVTRHVEEWHFERFSNT